MRRYVQMSGAVFSFISVAQLTRSILRWPVQVGTMSIPVWWSVVAFLVTASFAIWAFRASRIAT